MFKMSVGDCFSFIQNGANIKQGEIDGGYPITRIETISNNRFNRDRMGYAGITDITPYRAYVLEDGDILMSHINSVRYLGRAVKYSKHDDETIIHGMNLLRLKAIREIVIPDYACLYFSSRHFREQISRITKKSVNQASFSVADLRRTKMLIASLEEQKQIVALMSRIDGIMQTRKAEYKALDQLIKARFIELFGDPYSNPRNWKQMTFKEASTRLSDGPFGSNLKSEHYSDTGVRVIRLGNIGVGTFIDDDKSFIPVEHYEKLKKYTCRSGEIVIGTLGDPNLRACIIPQDIGIAINKADCVHFIPKHDVLNVTFACQYINCPETLLLAQGMIHGQTRARVSSGQIAEMPIFIPPMNLQNEFASFVSQVDKSKLSIQASLGQLETLKQSLMQKYFG